MDHLSSLLSSLKAVGHATVEEEYNVLRSHSVSIKRSLGLTCETGALKENIKKNRYKDILPYDQSRVVLTLSTSDSDSDYINASIIQGVSPGSGYIACQGPLGSTLTDFWRMIWQHKVKVIVMACREIEMGKKKCECYWAADHQSASFGPFTVSNQGETRPDKDVVVRTLNVSYQQEMHSMTQYQFLSWPDHNVPNETSGVLNLLQTVRNTKGGDTSPLLVHCSAGCGRTGVVCALDYIHDLLVTEQIPADFSILNVVLELRKQRASAVQTKDQYQFIYTAVCSMLENFLQRKDQQLYCNVSKLKKPDRGNKIASVSRHSQVEMNNTYAVVNKRRPPQPDPAYSNVTTPTDRMPPSSHHYDNEPSAAPVYSTIKPRAKKHTSAPPPDHDITGPTNESKEADYQLVSADRVSDDDYEDFSSSEVDVSSFSSSGGIGFNCRVQKPRGPRDPPAEWSRQER